MIYYSFIIPHYNTPKLLYRLLDSIPQREDIEIIVVDDNSDIDQKANVTRPDVKIIFLDSLQSKGAGRARNIGMNAAKGRWLLFADSDDFYKPGFIKVLDEYKDDNIDILFFNVDTVDSDTLLPGIDRTALEQKITNQYDGSKESSDEILFLRWGPWRKMLNREFVVNYSFSYEEIPNGNDVLFSLETSYFAEKWKVDKRIVYSLTYRKGSITYSNLSKKKYSTTINNMMRRNQFFKYIGHSDWVSSFFHKGYIRSVTLYILHNIRIRPSKGIEIFFYFITHFISIHKGANYYIDVINEIKDRMNCKKGGKNR